MIEFDWQPVESSNVEALCWVDEGYIPQRDEGDPGTIRIGTLYVAFKNGSVYEYPNTLECVYKAVLGARSVGGTFNTLVRRDRGHRIGQR